MSPSPELGSPGLRRHELTLHWNSSCNQRAIDVHVAEFQRETSSVRVEEIRDVLSMNVEVRLARVYGVPVGAAQLTSLRSSSPSALS